MNAHKFLGWQFGYMYQKFLILLRDSSQGNNNGCMHVIIYGNVQDNVVYAKRNSETIEMSNNRVLSK